MAVNKNEAPSGYEAVMFNDCSNCAFVSVSGCLKYKCRSHYRADGEDVLFLKTQDYSMPETQVTISDKAKAIVEMCNQLDSLEKESMGYNEEIQRAKNEFVRKVEEISKKHRVVLNKMIALQDTIELVDKL